MRAALLSILPLVLLPTACAHHRHHAHMHADQPVVEQKAAPADEGDPQTPAVELPRRRPDEAAARLSTYGKRKKTGAEGIRIEPRDGGWAWRDIFRFVSDETGVAIRYQESSATIKGRKLTFIGPMDVARDDLIAWLQDSAFYSSLAIVPQGPEDRRTYVAMDLADPALTNCATFVSEDELPALSGRVGLYVSCVLTLPEGLDPNRARNALSQMATRTAGIGRVSDLGKSGVLVVNDFAAVVASMRHALDRMDTSLYEDSVRK